MSERNLDLLSKPWQKFFIAFEELPSLPIENWKDKHMFMYLIQRYEKYYDSIYPFTFVRPPSRCTEYVFIKKIYQMLNSDNPEFIKQYVDWVFDTYIVKHKRKIKSFSYFLASDFVLEFIKLNKKVIERTTSLPEEFIMILSAMKIPAQTYGDLAFVKNAIAENPESPSSLLYQRGFSQLATLGFKEEQLKNLK